MARRSGRLNGNNGNCSGGGYGFRSAAEQRQAFANEAVCLGGWPVMDDRAIRAHNGRPTNGHRIGKERIAEVLSNAGHLTVQRLFPMHDPNERTAQAFECRCRCGFQHDTGVAAETDECASVAKHVVTQTYVALRVPDPALWDHSTTH